MLLLVLCSAGEAVDAGAGVGVATGEEATELVVDGFVVVEGATDLLSALPAAPLLSVGRETRARGRGAAHASHIHTPPSFSAVHFVQTQGAAAATGFFFSSWAEEAASFGEGAAADTAGVGMGVGAGAGVVAIVTTTGGVVGVELPEFG